MIFASLFIIAFIFGYLSYALTREWIIAVAIPSILFLISTFFDETALGVKAFTLTFGVPLVFFAGLLGAYVYQIRNFDPDEAENSVQQEDTNSSKID